MDRTLVVATGNAHKIREIGAMLAPLGVTVTTARELGVPDVPETGETFEDNAVIKAVSGFGGTGHACLADDSGLEVDALAGAPGVRSARYAGEPSDDANNNRKLIAALADVPRERRGARFVSAIALVLPADLAARVGEGAWHRRAVPEHPEATAFVVRGTVPGRIVDAPRGAGGFGYDPHFFYEPAGRTFAELAAEDKHAISHRGNAMAALKALFEALFA